MFIQTHHAYGTVPTFRARHRGEEVRTRSGLPSPAAFLRRNLDLTPASLARRGRGRPAGAGHWGWPPGPASPRARLQTPGCAPPRELLEPQNCKVAAVRSTPVWEYSNACIFCFILGRRGTGRGFCLKVSCKRRLGEDWKQRSGGVQAPDLKLLQGSWRSHLGDVGQVTQAHLTPMSQLLNRDMGEWVSKVPPQP